MRCCKLWLSFSCIEGSQQARTRKGSIRARYTASVTDIIHRFTLSEVNIFSARFSLGLLLYHGSKRRPGKKQARYQKYEPCSNRRGAPTSANTETLDKCHRPKLARKKKLEDSTYRFCRRWRNSLSPLIVFIFFHATVEQIQKESILAMR